MAAEEEKKSLKERAETSGRAERLGVQEMSGGSGGNFHFYGGRFGYSNRTPPEIRNNPGKATSWLRTMQLVLGNEDLEHTISTNLTGLFCGIICKDRDVLGLIHGEKLVADHQKAGEYLLEATRNTETKKQLAACSCVLEAWEVIQGMSLPTSDAKKALVMVQLEIIQRFPGEDPNYS